MGNHRKSCEITPVYSSYETTKSHNHGMKKRVRRQLSDIDGVPAQIQTDSPHHCWTHHEKASTFASATEKQASAKAKTHMNNFGSTNGKALRDNPRC